MGILLSLTAFFVAAGHIQWNSENTIDTTGIEVSLTYENGEVVYRLKNTSSKVAVISRRRNWFDAFGGCSSRGEDIFQLFTLSHKPLNIYTAPPAFISLHPTNNPYSFFLLSPGDHTEDHYRPHDSNDEVSLKAALKTGLVCNVFVWDSSRTGKRFPVWSNTLKVSDEK